MFRIAVGVALGMFLCFLVQLLVGYGLLNYISYQFVKNMERASEALEAQLAADNLERQRKRQEELDAFQASLRESTERTEPVVTQPE